VLALPAEQRTVLHLRYFEGPDPERDLNAARRAGEDDQDAPHAALATLREKLDERSKGDRKERVVAPRVLHLTRKTRLIGR
jgi:hypothetical protein